MTTLTVKCINKSTYVITSTFADADGTAVTPNALTWTLTNYDKTVINSRSAVVVTPAASVVVVLGALDTNITDGYERIFTIEGNYDSATYGNVLPIRGPANFTIEDE